MKGLWTVAAALVVGLVFAAPASAISLDNIVISKTIHRTNGTADGWEFGVEIHAPVLNDVIFANLDTSIFYGLTNLGGGDFEYSKSFPSLAAMNAEFDNNVSYWFYFNMHPGPTFDDQMILGYVANIPQGDPNITFPTNNATGVALDPNYQWDNAAGIAGTNDLGLWVFQGGNTVYEDVPETNKGLTNWQPGALNPGTNYEFQVGLIGLMNSNPIATSTLQGEGFTYFGAYVQGDSVSFTTGVGEVPEPATFALVGTAALTILGMGWRRRMK